MPDIIQTRLNSVTGLSDRRLLRNILYDVYQNMVDYNMDMYNRLEKRIYDEIEDPLQKFYIYTGLEHVKNVDPANDFLHPMRDSDLLESEINMERLSEALRTKGEFVLTSVFLECKGNIFNEIVNDAKRTFKGYVKTDKDTYEIRVRLRRCLRYVDIIESLYRAFQYNNIGWNTVNCPYAYKFADIILNSSLTLKKEEHVKEIIIDLAEYEKYKAPHMVPMWNVKLTTASDKAFPMPARDRINYDHVISLIGPGTQNGYLAQPSNQNFIYCKRNENDLVVIAPDSGQHEWNLLQIESPANDRQRNRPYELMTNKRVLGFTGRYAGVKSMIIRTKGEISRLMRSYEASQQLIFQDVEIIDKYSKPEETVNCNTFIDDNIRIDAYKKIMLVKFRPSERDSFTIQELMSFLTSELQILFPEYRCVGELV